MVRKKALMNYLKYFFVGFSIVFFVNYLFPGIDLVNQSKISHIGGDLIFPVVVGLLNSLVFPLLKAFDRRLSMVRISVVILILNFAAYVLLKLFSIGVYVTSVEGYFSGAIFVSFGSILMSYVRLREYRNRPPVQTHHHHE